MERNQRHFLIIYLLVLLAINFKFNKAISSSKRHFVLVHGAGHGAWCWYKITTLLQSDGHNVTALDLAASGINPRQIGDLKFSSVLDYVQPLINFMTSLRSKERVILVGHSRGGLGLSIAMERFPEKVAAAVFATAVMPGPNLTYVAILEETARRLGSYMDSTYIYGRGPNNPPTALNAGPNFLATKLYQLSPPKVLVMSHEQLLLRFAQHDSEPKHSAWRRYKELLIRFPYHGLTREFQLQNFLNGLCATTRTWVEMGNGTTSFYHLSVDDAYWMLDDMADYDYWCWNDFQHKSHSNNSMALLDTHPQGIDTTPELQVMLMEFVARSETKEREFLEKSERLKAIVNQIEEVVMSMSMHTMDVQITHEQDCHFEEPNKCEEHLKTSIDDASLKVKESLSEEETQGLDIQEAIHEDYDSQPLESTMVSPSSIEEFHIYEDLMWPPTPPPPLASFIQTDHAYPLTLDLVGAMCHTFPHLAKLEGVHN